jgi:hypothetical protein
MQEAAESVAPNTPAQQQPVLDLLGGLDELSFGKTAASSVRSPADDPFGLGGLNSAQPVDSAPPQLPLLSSAHSCDVHGDVVHDGMQYIFRVLIRNRSPGIMSGFHVQFNRNAGGVGLSVGNTALQLGPLNPGHSGYTHKMLDSMPDKLDMSLGPVLQTALKWTELTDASFVMLPVWCLLLQLDMEQQCMSSYYELCQQLFDCSSDVTA